MSKRYQPEKESAYFGRTTKKPKLDIRQHDNLTSNVIPNTQVLWDDDDDDDVILLATQVAESAVNALNVGSNITDSEITFTDFAPNVYASTSTQNLTAAPAVPQNILSEIFAADDDDDFAILEAAANVETAATHQNHNDIVFETEESPFKEPMQVMPISTKNIAKPASVNPPSQSIARRQLASEQKIKFLMERVETLKKENSRLFAELDDRKTKIVSKEGEASLLREELRHMKQRTQTLQMEKIFTTEATKNDYKTKLTAISKEMVAKETALQLKSMECSVLKMRHADEAKRLELSVRGEALGGLSSKTPARSLRALKRLRALNLNELPAAMRPYELPVCDEPAKRNERSAERGAGGRRTLFQLELATLQSIMAELKQESTCSNSALERILASVSTVLAEFWSYVHSLESDKNCGLLSYENNNIGDYKQEGSPTPARSRRQTLLQAASLHSGERAVSQRRYIATLSVACELLPTLACRLLAHRHGAYALLQIAADAIGKLSATREVSAHWGLLEAFAELLLSLLRSLVAQGAAATSLQLELLVSGVLKQLVFVRPNAWLFGTLSLCLLQCVELPNALGLLCANSRANAFVYDVLKSRYRFTPDSCILQVYAGLVEIAFPNNAVSMSPSLFHLLIALCGNHVRFVFECFAEPPHFIHDCLPCYDEEDDDEDANVPPAEAPKVTAEAIQCQCYTKLCLSVVTLLFQLLRHWTNCQLETPRVAGISKLSVHLLHIIYCDNYMTSLFRDSGEITKHFLSLICTWWLTNAALLQFNDIQLNFLRKLQNSHVLPKRLADEENLKNIAADLKDWQSLTNDKDDVSELLQSLQLSAACVQQQLESSAGDPENFFQGLKGYAFNF